MRVPLPDGSVRELPDGSTGADLAADIGPGLARAALAIRVLDGDKTEKRDGTAYDDGRIVDLAVPLADGQPVEIVTAKAGDGDALKLLRHDIAHVLAESVLELYPGTKVLDRPADRRRLLLRLRVPARRHDQRGRLREDRGADAQARQGRRSRSSAPRSRRPRRSTRYLREDQPYKVELIEDLVKNQGVETVGIYTNGAFRDLCRGPHAPDTGRAKAFKLTSRRRRLLARRREPPDAHPHLRHRVRDQGRAGRAPRAARAGARARPPQARQGARAVHVLRALAGLAVLVARTGWRSGTS